MKLRFGAIVIICCCGFVLHGGGPITHFPTPVGPGWNLTFDDEFNASAVNTSRWAIPNETADTLYVRGAWATSVTFEAANITETGDGFIRLATTNPSAGTYTTAAMTTTGFLQSGGYWEARVKPPCSANGVGAGFWTQASGFVFPEIDILEWIGIQPSANNTSWHYAVPNDGGDVTRNEVFGFPFCQNFHVIGMWWQPTSSITWNVDGVQVFTTSVNVNSSNNNPLWTVFDATVGGCCGFSNVPDGTSVFPATYTVDYVHVYCNACGTPVTPDPGYGGPGDAIGSGN